MQYLSRLHGKMSDIKARVSFRKSGRGHLESGRLLMTSGMIWCDIEPL